MGSLHTHRTPSDTLTPNTKTQREREMLTSPSSNSQLK